MLARLSRWITDCHSERGLFRVKNPISMCTSDSSEQTAAPQNDKAILLLAPLFFPNSPSVGNDVREIYSQLPLNNTFCNL